MRRKVQAVLPLWMEEFLERQAEKYDLTLSESIRIAISIAIICHADHKYSDFKSNLEKVGIPEGAMDMVDDPEAKRILSDIYFEARKAVEFIDNKDRVKKNGRKPVSK